MCEKNVKKEYVKRYVILCAGLLIMAFGVAFSIKAGLGTSPISSLPYAVSVVSPVTVGVATILMHCVFILLQILILKKNYNPIQLLQLPVALLFGFMTDAAVAVIENVECNSYLVKWLFCIIGIVLVAIGVSAEVTADVVTLAGEGLVIALCKVLPVKFGNMKICFDLTLVVLAVLVGLVFAGTPSGVREGTAAAAIFVGLLSEQICKPMARLTDNAPDRKHRLREA